jgi:hypothetical protein
MYIFQDKIIENNFRRILIDHSHRYPKWTIKDLYKLVYQAAKGCEHAVQDVERTQEWQKNEIDSLAPGFAEPLVDIISPDNQIARIHLRPFLASGHDSQILLEAFMQTARGFKGSTDSLNLYGQYIAQLATDETFSFTNDEIVNLFRSMEERGYPAIHHSSAFTAEYSPAYRVIAIEYLPKESAAWQDNPRSLE